MTSTGCQRHSRLKAAGALESIPLRATDDGTSRRVTFDGPLRWNMSSGHTGAAVRAGGSQRRRGRRRVPDSGKRQIARGLLGRAGGPGVAIATAISAAGGLGAPGRGRDGRRGECQDRDDGVC
jgi:hypothetical protein